ncbi:MAG: hypothetical protein QM785_05820 [Pyrinomonadaceae bacterium]
MSTIKYSVLPLLIFGASFLPLFNTTTVPQWRVQFVRKDGSPISNTMIRQTWHDYSLDFFKEVQRDTLSTDAFGTVEFPARIETRSAFGIALGRLRDLLASVNPHASYGNHSYVFCMPDIRGCSVGYKGNETPVARVVVDE